jgi:hypothetical protein
MSLTVKFRCDDCGFELEVTPGQDGDPPRGWTSVLARGIGGNLVSGEHFCAKCSNSRLPKLGSDIHNPPEGI